jgi:hypothetical protein
MRRWTFAAALVDMTGLIYASARAFVEGAVPLAVVAAVSIPFLYVLTIVRDYSFLLGGLALGFRLEQ